MSRSRRLSLFQAYGIELEYMIVDSESLAIKPIADQLFKEMTGKYSGEFENGTITWTNELVLHVIELKTTKPESNLNALDNGFADEVRKINSILKKWNAMLMPTAAHPVMNPSTETKLWPHDSNEIYEVYNQIFDCRGHGWSNLQATHLNLPFYDNDEFAKLHAAIRMVLPILPALCASSPILEGKLTGALDTRMQFYKTNQSKIPSITARIIPEPVFSKKLYEATIYDQIKTDIAPFDKNNILDPVWVNSRGAIARFDRGAIEIRVMDVQECPAADLAIQSLVIETLKALVAEKFINYEEQRKARTEILAGILDDTIRTGRQTEIFSSEFLAAFGFGEFATAGEVWKSIMNTLVTGGNEVLSRWEPELSIILEEGNLSERIIRSLNEDYSLGSIRRVYHQLCGCLQQNKLFVS